MNFETLISSALPSLIGLCVGRYVASNHNILVSAVMVIIFAALFFSLSQVIMYFLNFNKFERLIQGSWISITEDNTESGQNSFPYSLCEFKYNDAKKLLTYSGFSFSPNGKIAAEFKSTLIEPRPNNRKIIYVYEGHAFNSQKDTTIGLGFVRFFANSKGKYFTATGHFRGAGNAYKPIFYKLIRLTPDLCQELIKKDNVLNARDMKNIIMKFKDREDLQP